MWKNARRYISSNGELAAVKSVRSCCAVSDVRRQLQRELVSPAQPHHRHRRHLRALRRTGRDDRHSAVIARQARRPGVHQEQPLRHVVVADRRRREAWRRREAEHGAVLVSPQVGHSKPTTPNRSGCEQW